MSDNLINKKEALTLLQKRSQQLVGIYGDLGGALSGAARLIDELPAADRPQEWIPCSEDLIRRSDAINLCEKWRNRTNEHHDKNGWYIADTLLKAIKELPSADRPQEEWHNGFYDFLWNVINPNEMQKYIEIYEAQPIAVNGAQMKGADDDWTTQACIEIGR